MQQYWDFLQEQLLAMKWLNELVAQALKFLGVDIEQKMGR